MCMHLNELLDFTWLAILEYIILTNIPEGKGCSLGAWQENKKDVVYAHEALFSLQIFTGLLCAITTYLFKGKQASSKLELIYGLSRRATGDGSCLVRMKRRPEKS